MLSSNPDGFYSQSFQVLFEFSISIAFLVGPVGSELASTVHDEFSHWSYIPVSFNDLIDNLLAVLSVAGIELASSRYLSR